MAARAFDCCADIGYAAEDTHGNAAGSRELGARAITFTSLVMVTGALSHAARPARILRRHAGRDADRPIRWNRAASIWPAGGGIRAPICLLHREYVKYLASLVTTQHGAMHDRGCVRRCSWSGFCCSPLVMALIFLPRAGAAAQGHGLAGALLGARHLLGPEGLRRHRRSPDRGSRRKGGVLVASKHMSMWDTLALYLALDDPGIVLKRELLRIPFYGWYLWKAAAIAIDRSAGAEALRRMTRAAQSVLARRPPDPDLSRKARAKSRARAPDYKPGVAGLYSLLNVACVPVALNSGRYWQGFTKYPGTITLEFLEPIPPGLKRRDFMAAAGRAHRDRHQPVAAPMSRGGKNLRPLSGLLRRAQDRHAAAAQEGAIPCPHLVQKGCGIYDDQAAGLPQLSVRLAASARAGRVLAPGSQRRDAGRDSAGPAFPKPIAPPGPAGCS